MLVTKCRLVVAAFVARNCFSSFAPVPPQVPIQCEDRRLIATMPSASPRSLPPPSVPPGRTDAMKTVPLSLLSFSKSTSAYQPISLRLSASSAGRWSVPSRLPCSSRAASGGKKLRCLEGLDPAVLSRSKSLSSPKTRRSASCTRRNSNDGDSAPDPLRLAQHRHQNLETFAIDAPAFRHRFPFPFSAAMLSPLFLSPCALLFTRLHHS
jgi:hypothetical protein